jgi:hypothetical protein
MPTTAGSHALVSDTTTWSLSWPQDPIASGTVDCALTPATGSTATLAAGASVYVEIYDFETVQVPSTSTVLVAEAIGAGDPVFTNIAVSTFPDGFFFDSLIPTVQSGGALVPVAQVTNSASVTLTWNSSLVDTKNQTVYWSSATGGQQTATPSVLGEWTSPPLTSDTVFAVAVVAQSTGGEPLTAALVTGVSVQNPALVASSVTTGTATVTGTASITGALTANGITATGVTVNGTLTANGVSVNGAVTAASATLSGSLTAASATLSGGMTVGGQLSGNGSASLANLTVSGGLNVRSAPVAMIGAGTLLWTGSSIGTQTVYAPTDGFAFIQINGPGDNGKSSFTYGAVNTFGTWFNVLGGTVGSFGPGWQDQMDANTQSACIPIPRGTYWYYSAYTWDASQLPSPVYIYWIPLGAGPSGEQIRTLTETETAERGLTPPPPPDIDMASVQGGREKAAEAFVARLAKAVGTDLDGKTREKLAAELLRL